MGEPEQGQTCGCLDHLYRVLTSRRARASRVFIRQNKTHDERVVIYTVRTNGTVAHRLRGTLQPEKFKSKCTPMRQHLQNSMKNDPLCHPLNVGHSTWGNPMQLGVGCSGEHRVELWDHVCSLGCSGATKKDETNHHIHTKDES